MGRVMTDAEKELVKSLPNFYRAMDTDQPIQTEDIAGRMGWTMEQTQETINKLARNRHIEYSVDFGWYQLPSYDTGVEPTTAYGHPKEDGSVNPEYQYRVKGISQTGGKGNKWQSHPE